MTAVEQIDEPAHLVVLRVIRVIAGRHREGKRRAERRPDADLVDAAHHRFGHLRGQHLVRAVRAGHVGQAGETRAGVVIAVEEFDSRRGLIVDDVNVRQMREGDQGRAYRRGGRLSRWRYRTRRQFLAHEVRLAGRDANRPVAAFTRRTGEQRLGERRALRRSRCEVSLRAHLGRWHLCRRDGLGRRRADCECCVTPRVTPERADAHLDNALK